MIKKTLPFLLAAALGLSASAMVQAAGTAPKSKSVPLSQQVQDLRETVLHSKSKWTTLRCWFRRPQQF